jgi:dTDP-4-dehydrorhamnose 3,5-epimerase-like enzyme
MINIAESDRGRLTGINLSQIPFIPQRLFIVNNVSKNGIRSDHAHIKDNQMLFCLSGSLCIESIYKYKNQIFNDTHIVKEKQMFYIPALTWTRIKFLEDNTSLMCVCSELYDENEYIRNYEDFLRIINESSI